MARSPLFLFMVVLVVAVAFVMIVAEMQYNKPTGDPYFNTSSPINHTQAYIQGTVEQAPNWVIPGVFVTMAITLIGILWMVGRRTR